MNESQSKPFGKSENDLMLTDDVCLLGFSSGYLSLVFNTLRENKYKKGIKIIKNIPVDDEAPFNCGFDYDILKSSEYKKGGNDKYLICTSTPWIKETIFNHFFETHNIERGEYFNLIHHTTTVAKTASVNNGTYIEPGCIISPYANLGLSLSINRSASIGHHSTIGDFSAIQPGVHVAGHCTIGSKTTIGMGSVVFDHKKIGENTIIGGGSVVTKDIPAGVLAFGNPCRVIREL